MGIKVITDSICDVPKNYADRYGIRVMPLTVHFGNISYVDGIDLTLEEFLEKLEKAEALPTTSQVTPGDFFEAYKEEIAAGNKVISIHASSHLSGTYNSAVIAKEQMAGADIHVIDTMGISLGAGLLAIKAVRLAEEGMEAEDIVKQIEVSKQKMKYILVLDTLKYLQKGGRISLSAAMLGSILSIKPILTVVNGKLELFEKASRCRARAHSLMDNYLPPSAEVNPDVMSDSDIGKLGDDVINYPVFDALFRVMDAINMELNIIMDELHRLDS